MKKSILLFCLLPVIALFSASQVYAQITLNIPGIKGDSKVNSHFGWIDANDISFGVSRAATSTSKGGTQDINIGVGEFSEINIARNFDNSSTIFFKNSISGALLPSATIHLFKTENGMKYVFLEILLDRVFISKFDMAGGGNSADEKVALKFAKIKLRYLDSRGSELSSAGWDLMVNKPWN